MDSLFGDDRVDGVVKVLQGLTVVDTRGRPCPWPADDEKDRALISALMREFPHTDIAAKLPGLSAWMLDLKTKKGINYRARVRTWISICNRPRTSTHWGGHGSSGPQRVGSSAGGAPAAPGAFPASGRFDW